MSTPMLPSTLPVGSRIHNRYEVLGHLGGGANGQVYQVHDHNQNHVAALKVLDPHKPPPGGWFVEAEFLTKLRGDHILPVLNAADDAGVMFLVTELMPNKSTADRIPAGIGVPFDQAATWVQQACLGVSRILDKRVLHRDIKPANLFLDGHLNVLVGDFGLVCPMDAHGNGTAYGSAETLAPEVYTHGLTNTLTEVYSLGATLYQLISGHWLNPEVEAMVAAAVPASQVFAAVAAHTPTPIGDIAPHVPVGLRSIIMTAVDPDPARRYPNPTAFAAALGGRTKPKRTWTRTAPCTGHTMCFTGTCAGANDYQLCAVPAGARGRLELQSRHSTSGRRINPWPVVTPGALAGGIRSRIAALTQR